MRSGNTDGEKKKVKFCKLCHLNIEWQFFRIKGNIITLGWNYKMTKLRQSQANLTLIPVPLREVHESMLPLQNLSCSVPWNVCMFNPSAVFKITQMWFQCIKVNWVHSLIYVCSCFFFSYPSNSVLFHAWDSCFANMMIPWSSVRSGNKT